MHPIGAAALALVASILLVPGGLHAADGAGDADPGVADRPTGGPVEVPTDHPAEDMSGPAIHRAGSVGLSPRVSPLGATDLNDDFTLGLTVDLWPADWIGVEANASFFPLGAGAHDNSSGVAVAVLRLLESSYRLEALERDAAVSVSVVVLPFRGHIGPPGAPGASMDFLLALGGGVEFDRVELLAHEGQPGVDEEAVRTSVEPHVRGLLNFVFGTRMWLSPQLGLRVEGRLLGGPDRVLDRWDERAAETNREAGPGVSRLDCSGVRAAEVVCAVDWEGTFTVEFAVDFGLGARSTAPGGAAP